MSKASKPKEKNIDELPVRLVLCLDGTGDTIKGSYDPISGLVVGDKDNIVTIYEMTKAGNVDDEKGKFFQRVEYFEGVGTEKAECNSMLDRLDATRNVATGHGYLKILKNAYKVCCEQVQPVQGRTHEIFIFGFSRGAFISRALASFLQHVGLLKSKYLEDEVVFEEKFCELLWHYHDATSTLLAKALKIARLRSKKANKNTGPLPEMCHPSPRVRLVGAFDTVKADYGKILGFFENGMHLNFQMDAPGIVDNFRHALALNEKRYLFSPDLWHLDALQASCSYEEAWFFGFHHDVGGGADEAGLSLWPLQWILHEASKLGLVLDPDVHPYEVIFTGHDEPKVISTPHKDTVAMFDMIQHIQTQKRFGLKLNQPSALLPSIPRRFTKYLTQPPYSKILRPKVFIHPSAYLVFDISADFRMQIHKWEYYRSFLNSRFDALNRGEIPWWEAAALKNILRQNPTADHLNVLAIGRASTNMEEIVSHILGHFEFTSRSSIHVPIVPSDNDKARLYLSRGIGDGEGCDTKDSFETFLREHRDDTNSNTRIHAIWYFLDCSKDPIPREEKQLFQMNFGSIPIITVHTNVPKLLPPHHNSPGDEKSVDIEVSTAADRQALERALNKIKSSVHAILHMKETLEHLQERINGVTHFRENFRKQMEGFPVRKFIDAVPSDLLQETLSLLPDQGTQSAAVQAQRLDIQPKITLAIEECIRPYAIWLNARNKSLNSPREPLTSDPALAFQTLTTQLIDPLLSCFNSRFEGDTALIISEVGAEWQILDLLPGGIHDPDIVPATILMCTLDTLMVMTKAMSSGSLSSALTSDDMKKACSWYRGVKQAEIAAMIKKLLKDDGQPECGSISSFQAQIIEIVELRSEWAVKAWPLSATIKQGLDNVLGSSNIIFVSSAIGSVLLLSYFLYILDDCSRIIVAIFLTSLMLLARLGVRLPNVSAKGISGGYRAVLNGIQRKVNTRISEN